MSHLSLKKLDRKLENQGEIRSMMVYIVSLVQMATPIDIHGRCMSTYVHE